MTMLNDKKIIVLMGGASTEREISLRSGQAVFEALQSLGLNAVAVDLKQDTKQWIHQIEQENADVAFIALHGTYGEDGCVQGMLDIMQLPYTGSGVTASALCMDKKLTKAVLEDLNIQTPIDVVMKHGKPMSYPVFIKPVAEGSSVGLFYVSDEAAWDVLGVADIKDCLIEQCVVGVEVAISVVDSKALPPVEVAPKSGMYDYASKYTAGATDYYCPARLSNHETLQCKKIAEQAVTAMGCLGAPRVDLIVPEVGSPVVLEINTLPGMTATSLLPKAAAEVGISFPELCKIITASALNKGEL
ncbi:MAG: D-alanine--D-alanine ligase [Ghiorsea sp.]